MNICFVMYPWERVDPKADSTLRLIHQSYLNGHTVGMICANNLTVRSSVTYGFCKMLETSGKKYSSKPAVFYCQAKFKEELLPLSGFDVIFIRTNPPLDTRMLNFLDSVQNDTFIINHVDGLRKADNKLYSAAFDESLIPVTHVSKNKSYLRKMIEESPSDKMILKPLDGFGGSGVIVLEKTAMQNVNSLLDFYIGDKNGGNYVILQEYIEGAENGDIRVLLLNGEPIGAMRRVPAVEEIRSNIHVGGTSVKHTLTKKEKELCLQVGKKLVEDGLYFVGLDIIGDKLIEVNVCSPGGITRINKLNRTNLQQKVLEFVEDIVHQKELAHQRKATFRLRVKDA